MTTDLATNGGDQSLAITDQNDLRIIIQQQSLISIETINLIRLMAPIYHRARCYGYTSEDQAAMVMLKAAGLGIPPTSAPDFFDVIEGKPALKPVGALALIHRSGVIRVEIDETSRNDACIVTMTRLDTGYTHTVIYTDDEAVASNLIKPGKDNSAWNRFRVDLRRWRAVGRCARIVVSDIIGGMPLTHELEELRSRRSQLPKPSDCDHFAAVAGDVTCPTCGAAL